MIKKRGRRPKLSIVKVIAIAAALLAVAFCAVFFGFQTKEIQIKGNDYTSEEEILEVIGSDSLSSNTLGLLFKYRFTNYELPKSLTKKEEVRINFMGIKNAESARLVSPVNTAYTN